MCDDEKSSSSKSNGTNAVNIAGRITAMGLAVVEAVLMASANECTVVFSNSTSAHTITYRDFGPFVYLVVANAMAAMPIWITIFLSVWKKGEGKRLRVLLPILDAAVPALLYSASGAAFATGEYMSYSSAQGWRVSVCAAAGSNNFCSQVHVAMYLSITVAATVSAVEVVKNMKLSLSRCGSGFGSDSGSDDDGCGSGRHASNDY